MKLQDLNCDENLWESLIQQYTVELDKIEDKFPAWKVFHDFYMNFTYSDIDETTHRTLFLNNMECDKFFVIVFYNCDLLIEDPPVNWDQTSKIEKEYWLYDELSVLEDGKLCCEVLSSYGWVYKFIFDSYDIFNTTSIFKDK